VEAVVFKILEKFIVLSFVIVVIGSFFVVRSFVVLVRNLSMRLTLNSLYRGDGKKFAGNFRAVEAAKHCRRTNGKQKAMSGLFLRNAAVFS
jgi:hypothetical protein